MGMTLDIDKIKALALAATPGPWRIGSWIGHCKKPSHAPGSHPGARGDDPCVYTPFFMEGCSGIAGPEAAVVAAGYDGLEVSDADAAYITECHPATVLALIAEVEASRCRAQGGGGKE